MFTLKRAFNSWDAIKVIALLLMFVDHAGAFFIRGDDGQLLRAIGRGAAPIFLFLAGYASSYKFKWELGLLALAMTISDYLLVGHLRTQNILVTILLTRMIFYWMERQDKIITNPYSWQIAAAFWLTTSIIVQYGSFGIIFGICGYVKRRPQFYPKYTFENLLILAFVYFALFTQFAFGFDLAYHLIMLVVLSLVCWLLIKLELGPMNTSRAPEPIVWGFQKMAVYSGYIYAFHLIALEWITGHPF